MGAEAMVGVKMWGTWEELVLGGAVLRHGTHDWDAVASELRARTLYPFSFTPEVCKAKYEDLQQRYSGCTAWFEELRKRRVAELKRALERSEDSIGSLESKLETLKADKGDYCHIDYSSSQTESPVPFKKFEGVESSGKEASKDGLSAGSFTQETRTNWLPECHLPAVASAEETETKPEVSECSERERVSESSKREKVLESFKRAKVSSLERLSETIYGGLMQNVRKRRGKRKRKDCNRNVKEGSVGESDILGCINFTTASGCKKSSMGYCGQIARASSVIDRKVGLSKQGIDDLMGILDSVMKNENTTVFRCRLDSQKRARYKKLIRRHMDFDTIRSGISNRSITSAEELFRDLLLLSNNALVFYSKRSREHKSAMLLRELVTKTLRQHSKDSCSRASTAILSTSPLSNPPVKPRSARPCKRKLPGRVASAENALSGTSQASKKASNGNSPPPVELVKKGSSRQGKVGRGAAGHRPETPLKGRKKAQER